MSQSANDKSRKNWNGSANGNAARFDAHAAPASDQPDQINDGWRKLSRVLRGRYKMLAIAVVCLGALFALLGYLSGGRSYKSTGLIRVSAETRGVLDSNEFGIPQNVYDAFVDAQLSTLKDRKVIDVAVQDLEWKRLNPEFDDQQKIPFINAIDLERRSSLIYVSFIEGTADKAIAGVNAVLNSYKKLYVDEDNQGFNRRMNLLTEWQTSLAKQENDVRLKILEVSAQYGSDNIESVYAAKLESMKNLDKLILDQQVLGATLFGLKADEAKDKSARLAKVREAAQLELVAIGRDKLKVGEYSKLLDGITVQANELKRGIDRARADAQLSSRIEIVSFGDKPLTAYKSTRFKNFIFGGAFGTLLGFSLVFAFAFFDPRLHAPMDLHRVPQPVPVLGVLPDVDHDGRMTDPQAVEKVAHCVHHVRAMLQISNDGNNQGAVFGITGPAAGSGKTTLSLALGISYASSGARVLLIDTDLAGGGLSGRVDAVARPKLGQMLYRSGWITEDQLRTALNCREKSLKPLGEVLLDLDFITEEELKHALNVQTSKRMGLLDAMRGEPLDDCIAHTGIGNLSVLTLGNATPGQASHLSPQGIRRLIDRVRPGFDVVILDTGPVLGSLEAAVVLPQVDGVILTVSRGDNRNLVSRCIDRLGSLNAKITGIVFNRAAQNDVLVEDTSSRYGSRREDEAGLGLSLSPEVDLPVESERFGPVARAVVSSTPRLVKAG